MLPLNIFLSWPAVRVVYRRRADRGGMEQADAWELRPGENGPESAAPGATTARHFINELVKNAATGSETAGEKMKALAMHLLEAQGWERVKDIRESLTESMLTSAITPRWGSLMSARL